MKSLSRTSTLILEYRDVMETRARPWQKEGWSELIKDWLGSRLKADVVLGEPYRTDLVFVVRVQAGEKRYYFKAGDGSREARVSAYIASVFPDLTPEVIAYNGERDWLLTKDAGQHLSTFADVNVWQKTLVKLATFQGQADVTALQGLGCPFDRFETLADRGEAFLENQLYLQSWGMNNEQRESSSSSFLTFVRPIKLFTHSA
jgi:hypothetical protein